jgi:hypothetical protein
VWRAAFRPEQQRIALGVVADILRRRADADEAAIGVARFAAEMPFETIVERLFLPRWIILVPVSACWWLLVTATE